MYQKIALKYSFLVFKCIIILINMFNYIIVTYLNCLKKWKPWFYFITCNLFVIFMIVNDYFLRPTIFYDLETFNLFKHFLQSGWNFTMNYVSGMRRSFEQNELEVITYLTTKPTTYSILWKTIKDLFRLI